MEIQVDQIQKFEQGVNRAIYYILLIVTCQIIGINAISFFTDPSSIIWFYVIIHLAELGTLSILVKLGRLSLNTTELLLSAFLVQISVERILIDPAPHMLYSSIGVHLCYLILSPSLKVFRILTISNVLILFTSFYLATISTSFADGLTVLFCYWLIYILGASYIRLRETISQMVFDSIIEEDKYKNSKMSMSDFEEIQKKIEYFIKDQKKFLSPEYNAKKLANDLGVSNPILSQVLSMGMQTNFSKLLNEYRIKEVKRRLRDPGFSDEKILSIALDCGFSSKSSFNMTFKQFTGQTPKEFREG